MHSTTSRGGYKNVHPQPRILENAQDLLEVQGCLGLRSLTVVKYEALSDNILLTSGEITPLPKTDKGSRLVDGAGEKEDDPNCGDDGDAALD